MLPRGLFLGFGKDSPGTVDRLVAGKRDEHRPELGAALAPRECTTKRTQIAADGLQLTDDRPGSTLLEIVGRT